MVRLNPEDFEPINDRIYIQIVSNTSFTPFFDSDTQDPDCETDLCAGKPYSLIYFSDENGAYISNVPEANLAAVLSTKDMEISEDEIQIYPNPTKDFIQISSKFNKEIQKVEIYDYAEN